MRPTKLTKTSESNIKRTVEPDVGVPPPFHPFLSPPQMMMLPSIGTTNASLSQSKVNLQNHLLVSPFQSPPSKTISQPYLILTMKRRYLTTSKIKSRS